MLNRRHLVRLAGATALAPLAARSSLAQGSAVWPNRVVKLVVPFTPGGGIDAVGRPLQEIAHDLSGGLEDGCAQKHFQFLDGDPVGGVGLETGHQLPDFLVLGQEELWRGVFFFAPADRSARVRSTMSWAYCATRVWNCR